MKYFKSLLVCAVALVCTCRAAHAQMTLDKACPGNLIVNGDFETPNTEVFRSQVDDPSNNPKWAWYYNNITGWYTERPDGSYCVKVDWQRNYIELARGALATPIEGKQYGELLPNGTGNYCQDLKLQKGATYRLSWYFGRLMTFAKGTQTWTVYDTSMDVAIKPSSYRTPPTGIWPKDKQGFTIIGSADNEADYKQHSKQWVRHEVEFTAPANEVTLALINTKRPKSCGACGSLIDAVCLQKVEKPITQSTQQTTAGRKLAGALHQMQQIDTRTAVAGPASVGGWMVTMRRALKAARFF